jgi:pantothenate kinase
MNNTLLSNEEVTAICDATIDEGVNVFIPVRTLRRLVRESETLFRIAAGSPPVSKDTTVDCLGLALQLESASKKVQSQTALRAMEAAAQGLRNVCGK